MIVHQMYMRKAKLKSSLKKLKFLPDQIKIIILSKHTLTSPGQNSNLNCTKEEAKLVFIMFRNLIMCGQN